MGNTEKSIGVLVLSKNSLDFLTKEEAPITKNFGYLPANNIFIVTSIFPLSELDDVKIFSTPINEVDLKKIGDLGSEVIKTLTNKIPEIINIGINPDGLRISFKQGKDAEKFKKQISSLLEEIAPIYFF